MATSQWLRPLLPALYFSWPSSSLNYTSTIQIGSSFNTETRSPLVSDLKKKKKLHKALWAAEYYFRYPWIATKTFFKSGRDCSSLFVCPPLGVEVQRVHCVFLVAGEGGGHEEKRVRANPKARTLFEKALFKHVVKDESLKEIYLPLLLFLSISISVFFFLPLGLMPAYSSI